MLILESSATRMAGSQHTQLACSSSTKQEVFIEIFLVISSCSWQLLHKGFRC